MQVAVYSAVQLAVYQLQIFKAHSLFPVVTYASGTWILKETIIQKLLVFERKILRSIFGPTKENQILREKNH
jgi:hypothetical protein